MTKAKWRITQYLRVFIHMIVYPSRSVYPYDLAGVYKLIFQAVCQIAMILKMVGSLSLP